MRQNGMLAKMTLADVNTVNRQYLPTIDNMNIVLVGDKAKVWDGVQKLGYEIIELDANGDPVQ